MHTKPHFYPCETLHAESLSYPLGLGRGLAEGAGLEGAALDRGLEGVTSGSGLDERVDF